jgi:hypothetical protein
MAPWHSHPAAQGPAGAGAASLVGSGDLANIDHPRYSPTELLARFTLLMAGHGRCVLADMMLGDREYAMWQLACGRAIDGDPELARVATRLFAYFDDPEHSGTPVLGIA